MERIKVVFLLLGVVATILYLMLQNITYLTPEKLFSPISNASYRTTTTTTTIMAYSIERENSLPEEIEAASARLLKSADHERNNFAKTGRKQRGKKNKSKKKMKNL